MQSQDLRKILIECSTYCNAGCPHCARYTPDGFVHPSLPLRHLDLTTLEKSLDKTSLTNLEKVSFGGGKGDPAMNPNLLDFVKFFDFVPMVGVNSNGGIQSQSWWQQLAQAPNLVVTFSVDGLEDTNHLYRVNVVWDRVVNNIRAFVDAGGKAVWKTVIFQHNEHQIDEIIKFSKELGCSQTDFKIAWKFPFADQDTWPVMIKGKLSHYISDSKLTMRETQSKSVVHVPSSKTTYVSEIIDADSKCPWLSKGEIFVDALGYVLPCCHTHFEHLNDYPDGKEFVKLVGDLDSISLMSHSLDQVLASEFFTHRLNDSLQQKETMHRICKGCLGVQ
jgi:MoaA/NifB/PqqE/SkfB family radical SAM enzyme